MAYDRVVNSSQLDSAMTATANAIRAKTGTENAIQWNPQTGFSSNVESINDWHCPPGWPDIESVSIPPSNEVNTIYLLYWNHYHYNVVSFNTDNNNKHFTVSKGTIENGRFVGEVVADDVLSFSDTLSEEYTVYQIIGIFEKLAFPYGVTNNYTATIQSVVWIYGNAPVITTIGSNAEFLAGWGIHTKRFKLYNAIHANYLTLTDYFSYRYAPGCFWLGTTENGNFGGNTLARTGNGKLFYQDCLSDKELVIQNANFNISSFGRIEGKKIRFKKVTGELRQQAFQSNSYVKSVSFDSDCSITCTSMYYQFYGCTALEYCDLQNVDFSSCTSSASAFTSCGSLEYLRLNNTWAIGLSLSGCYSLTYDSIIGIFNDLPTIETTQTITLPYGMKKYVLSEDDIAIITAKGWTVA